jgi:hypothetical protein
MTSCERIWNALTPIRHLDKWSYRLAFDDLAHGSDGEEWRCGKVKNS